MSKPIGVSEDGEEVYPDGATRGWECPGGDYDWRAPLTDAEVTLFFDEFVRVAKAAWNRRNKGI